MPKSEDILKLENLFDQLHQGLIYFATQYLKNEDEAIEVVNDSFMAIWERRETLPLDDSVKGYLYTTVRNKCLNKIKKSNPEKYSEDVQEINKGEEYTIQHSLEAVETEIQINAAIDSLPKRCKEIFLLSRKEGMSYKQIAETLGLTPKTIENQIGIALKHLKEALKYKS